MFSLFRKTSDGVGLRIGLTVAVALTPLAIVTVVRSEAVVAEARARSEAVLKGETVQAISDEVALIEQARGAATAFASRFSGIGTGNPDRCNAVMAAFVAGQPYTFAGFYDTTGLVVCSSAGSGYSFGVSPELLEDIADPRPRWRVNADAPLSEASVVYASAPAFDSAGDVIGFAAVSLPHTALKSGSPTAREGLAFYTVTAEGTVLTWSEGSPDLASILPDGETDPATLLTRSRPFTATLADGSDRTFAVATLVTDELYAVGTLPADAAPRTGLQGPSPTLFSALMWLASLAAAWFAADRFVLSHIQRLRGNMANFMHSRKRPALSAYHKAPLEIRELAESFADLLDAMEHDEAELEDTIYEKDILLRELHHRVKNNLQLIASIMNMQIRQAETEESRTMLRNLHDRVMSLATIHRELYQTSGQMVVRADELLDDICRQIRTLGGESPQHPTLETDFEAMSLIPDQAVPLSLLLVEGLTNALKYADTSKDPISLSLTRLDAEQARLVISNRIAASDFSKEDPNGSKLGSRLMQAFAKQLSGTLETDRKDGLFQLTMTFRLAAPNGKKTNPNTLQVAVSRGARANHR